MVHDKWRIMQWCRARLIEPADGHLHCVCVKMASNKSPEKVQKFPKGQQKAAKRSIKLRVDILEGDGQPNNVESI